jgi:signal transduction histidine kinase
MNRTKTKCISYDYTAQFTMNILAHIGFLIFLLTIIFSFYTEKIMSDAVNGQINKLIDENFDKIIDEKQISETKEKIKNLGYEPQKYLELIKKSLSEEGVREKHNKNIKNILYIFSAGILFTIVFSFIITKMLCTKIKLLDILMENFIIFFFVGIIELLFFKYILLNYKPAYPSDIKNIFLEKLKKY